MKGRIGLATVIATVIAVVLAAAPARAGPFPDSVPLPDDFAPEGIAVGAGSTFYVGSLTTGDIYRGDFAAELAASSSSRAGTGGGRTQG